MEVDRSEAAAAAPTTAPSVAGPGAAPDTRESSVEAAEVAQSRRSCEREELVKAMGAGLGDDSAAEEEEEESARSKLISEALQREDEFLEYLMSLPAVAEASHAPSVAVAAGSSAAGTPSVAAAAPAPPPVFLRSTSQFGDNPVGGKVGLDHLDNLCKLMEQLGDLREQNSKLQRRVQYLEELKNLHEMHKQLQQPVTTAAATAAVLAASAGTSPRRKHRHSSANTEEQPPAAPLDRDDSPSKSKSKSKTAGNSKIRQTLMLRPQRERSRSVGIEELKADAKATATASASERPAAKRLHAKNQKRRSVGGVAAPKAKVSKWTKVKEAFRWEKAAAAPTEHGAPELALSASRSLGAPAPSGDPSPPLPPPPALSSSSSSEDLDIELNFADILAELGPQRSASATDSTCGRLGAGPGAGPGAETTPRRLSLSCAPDDEEAGRRSKSLDGDATVARLRRRYSGKAAPDAEAAGVGEWAESKLKAHKTPWGKVKDIIQTRKDSLKKRHTREEDASPPPPDDAPTTHDPLTARRACDGDGGGGGGGSGSSGSPASRRQMAPDSISPATLAPVDASDSGAGAGAGAGSAKASRRLTPMLTLTLPSSEDMRVLAGGAGTSPSPGARARPSNTCSSASPPALASAPAPCPCGRPPPSPHTEERTHKTSTASVPGLASGGSDDALCGRQASTPSPRPTSCSAGTSPPVHRRAHSKWTKVKKAFLTSGPSGATPARRSTGSAHASSSAEDADARVCCSVPSSPSRSSSFVYDLDGDEADSGLEGEDAAEGSASVQAEIRRHYEELQQRLSLEFHRKLAEWERMKASAGPPCAPLQSQSASNTSSGGGGSDDVFLQHTDKGFRRKMEEWERMRGLHHHSQRDSRDAPPALDEDHLSPDFRKKLHEWERMKRGGAPAPPPPPPPPPLPPPPPPPPPPQPQGPSGERRPRLAEWPPWRDGERSRTASAGGDESTPARTPSPGRGGGAGGGGAGGGGREQARSKLQWLEKELHKIEREKQRLEREREKYLEREARLEKMRRAMGAAGGAAAVREVLVQTSSGLLRFEGISEKFTRRLYEWEKARGIGPEASTFALLDPGYAASAASAVPAPAAHAAAGAAAAKGAAEAGDAGLARSKSAGSVAALSGAGTSSSTITRQPSSLSLNDAPSMAQPDEASIQEEPRALSEPRLSEGEGGGAGGAGADDEPAAVIVDVEAVVEETAAPLAATPAVRGHTPIYSYAPDDVTRLIDSSGSDSDRDRDRGAGGAEPRHSSATRSDSARTEASCKLLDENMSLLTRLRAQEHICRKIENELEDIGEKIDDVAKTHEEELERLRQEEQELTAASAGEAAGAGAGEGDSEEQVAHLRTRIHELERRRDRLQGWFEQHSAEQAELAQNLVGNMKQLQAAPAPAAGPDALRHMQRLSSQLLRLAERLELAVAQRSREVQRSPLFHSLGSLAGPEAGARSPDGSEGGSEAATSAGRLPRQSSEELAQLPALLTAKVLELRRGLAMLCTAAAAENDNAEPHDDPEQNDATFVMCPLPPTSGKASAAPQGQGDVSPVSVTVVPAFWRRPSATDSASASASTPAVAAASPDPTARHSYSSAVSSTASEDEDEEEEEETEDREDSDASERAPTARRLPGPQRSRSQDDSDYSRPSCGAEAAAAAGEEGYETEVPQGGVPPARARRLLKTRRISDSTVGYASAPDGPAHRTEADGATLPAAEVGAASPASVFVQTTRKIFSPVRRDSKGKASSVVGYVVGERAPAPAPAAFSPVSGSPWRQRDAEAEEAAGGLGGGAASCWMLRRSRSQSSSPALPRRRGGSEDAGGGGDASTSSGSKSALNQSTDSEEGRAPSVGGSGGRPGAGARQQPSPAPPSPSAGFPPLPHSPSPGRRDLFKVPAKEAAPSIRMMIAKYNQKLSAAQDGSAGGGAGGGREGGGRSPDRAASGQCSPVAWRSPAAERRVRAQTERYQQEVRRALQQGCPAVQKSASAGVIRAGPAAPAPATPDASPRLGPTRGILKSNSAGAIKPAPAPAPAPDLRGLAGRQGAARAEPLGLEASVSATVRSPSPGPSADAGSPAGRLRKLRLQRAKEEFFSRGPGARSWAPADDATSCTSGSTLQDPFDVPQSPSTLNGANRLSQVSVGSESSVDQQLLLVKSASAGALVAGRRAEREAPAPGGSLPRTGLEQGSAKHSGGSKFGISSITSRFRKVRMRRGKEKEPPRMSAVSQLCRQSLLVDLRAAAAASTEPASPELAAAAPGPSSKSCPSSPVLQRGAATSASTSSPSPSPSQPPLARPEDTASSSWIRNPARRMFWNK